MNGPDTYYPEDFEYQPKRTSPLVKLFVIAGAAVLVFISGNLAVDVLNPDDSGLMPPVGTLSVNTESHIVPIARAPAAQPEAVIKTAAIAPGSGPDASTRNGFGIPAPQQLNIQSLPAPQTQAEMAALPEPTPAPDAAPEQETPSQPTTTPAEATMRKVVTFTQQWAGTTDKTSMRKYARTKSVLGQCGLMHIRTLKLYEGKNKPVYKQVEQRRAAKLARNAGQGQPSPASVGAINPADFTLGMKEGTHNPNLASMARGNKMNTPIADDPYPEDLDKDVCKLLDAEARAGAFDIKL